VSRTLPIQNANIISIEFASSSSIRSCAVELHATSSNQKPTRELCLCRPRLKRVNNDELCGANVGHREARVLWVTYTHYHEDHAGLTGSTMITRSS
jgi:hypothetical protein